MTSSFKHILFPVDFSPQSHAVAPFVQAMAKCFDAEVTALHVSPDPSQDDVDSFVDQALFGADTLAVWVEGDPAQSIVKYAHEHQTDLIMMPTHGYGPFRAMLLGSVTAKVLHDARCPVWTGVHAEKMLEHSPARWKRVLCALNTDLDVPRGEGPHGEGPHVLPWTLEFAHGQNLEVRVVHAVAGSGAMWTEEIDPSMYEFLFHAAREKLAALQAKLGTTLDIVLLPGDVGAAVRQAALDFNADLIVIGRGAAQHAFGPLRSHAYEILRDAPCPVISTP